MTGNTEAGGKLSVEEMTESLTGYDEIAIRQKFGQDLTELPPLSVARSLCFVLLTRGDDGAPGAGVKPADAYKAVMEMTVKAVNAHFSDGDDDAAADLEAAAGVGKGGNE